MKRTKLCDRVLPTYTKGEELFHTISHGAGAVFGLIALITCLLLTAGKGNPWGVVSASIYGVSLILLYTMSSLYHGIRHETAKKVFQVIDHCTIYLLIAGTYTPVMLCSVRLVSKGWAFTILAMVWSFAIIAAIFTAIDLKRFSVFSMICYISMGWCVIFAIKPTIEAVKLNGLLWLLAGGIAYTVGAVLYGLGKKHRYMHSIFHVFVLAGSIFQYIAIIRYVF